MRKVKFGKRTAVVAAILVLCVGLAYGAVVNYLSNTIEKPVTVKSPIELTGTITYEAFTGYGPGEPKIWHIIPSGQSFDQVEAIITKTEDTDSVEFEVEIRSENAPHGVYGMGIVISTVRSTMDFQVFYREWQEPFGWYYQEYDPDTGWTGELHELQHLGITATGNGAEGEKVFTVDIPIELLGGWGEEYYFAIQLRTNLIGTYPQGLDIWAQTDASNFAEATVGEPVFELKTADFDGDGVSVELHGNDEFSMSFKAENLANKPIEAPLALVMDCPTSWERGKTLPEIDEIAAIEPAPHALGYSSGDKHLVLVFDELGTIGAGTSRELTINMRLAENAENGTYTIKALVLWEGLLRGGKLVLGDDFATAPDVNARTTRAQAKIGKGSWANDRNVKTEFYLSPEMLGLEPFKIADIANISYATYKPAGYTEDDLVDFYIAIYTEPDGEEDEADWYGYRLNGEPYYSRNLDSTVGWHVWSTHGTTNQLTFFDSDKIGGYYGFHNGQPTLPELQSTAAFNWSECQNAPPNTQKTSIDYGSETVKYISFQTGTGWYESLESYIDEITIELTDGTVVIIDLEPSAYSYWQLTEDQVKAIVAVAP